MSIDISGSDLSVGDAEMTLEITEDRELILGKFCVLFHSFRGWMTPYHPPPTPPPPPPPPPSSPHTHSPSFFSFFFGLLFLGSHFCVFYVESLI
jgi:hypothetical protein